MARKTRNWLAVEHTDFAGADRHLTVSGEVETVASNEHPVLNEAVPQGINPKILILVLDVEATGVGNDVVRWKAAVFTKPCSLGQYDEVTIRNGTDEQTIKVHRVIS